MCTRDSAVSPVEAEARIAQPPQAPPEDPRRGFDAPGQDQDLDLAVQLWPQLMAHIQQPFDQSAAYDESIQALKNLFNIEEQA